MNTLTILCFDRYSKMLSALNSLQDASAIVEVGTTHRNQHVLMYAGEVSGDAKNAASDSIVITNPHADLLPAYFKQKAVRVEKNVVCVESERLSTAFEAANTALMAGFQCVEINRAMSDSGMAVVLLANGKDISDLKKMASAIATSIVSPTAQFKKYF